MEILAEASFVPMSLDLQYRAHCAHRYRTIGARQFSAGCALKCRAVCALQKVSVTEEQWKALDDAAYAPSQDPLREGSGFSLALSVAARHHAGELAFEG